MLIADVSEFSSTGIKLELVGLGDAPAALALQVQSACHGTEWHIVPKAQEQNLNAPHLAILEKRDSTLRLRKASTLVPGALESLPRHVLVITGGGKRVLVPLQLPAKTHPLLVQFRNGGSRVTLSDNLSHVYPKLRLSVTGLQDAPPTAGIETRATPVDNPHFIVLRPTTEHVPGIRLRASLELVEGKCRVQVTPEFVRHPTPATSPAKKDSQAEDSFSSEPITEFITPNPGSNMTLFDFAASDVLHANAINVDDIIRRKQQLVTDRSTQHTDVTARRDFLQVLRAKATDVAKSSLVGDQAWVEFQQQVAARLRTTSDAQQRDLQASEKNLLRTEQELAEIESLEHFIAQMHQRLSISFRVSCLTLDTPVDVLVAEE